MSQEGLQVAVISNSGKIAQTLYQKALIEGRVVGSKLRAQEQREQLIRIIKIGADTLLIKSRRLPGLIDVVVLITSMITGFVFENGKAPTSTANGALSVVKAEKTGSRFGLELEAIGTDSTLVARRTLGTRDQFSTRIRKLVDLKFGEAAVYMYVGMGAYCDTLGRTIAQLTMSNPITTDGLAIRSAYAENATPYTLDSTIWAASNPVSQSSGRYFLSPSGEADVHVGGIFTASDNTGNPLRQVVTSETFTTFQTGQTTASIFDSNVRGYVFRSFRLAAWLSAVEGWSLVVEAEATGLTTIAVEGFGKSVSVNVSYDPQLGGIATFATAPVIQGVINVSLKSGSAVISNGIVTLHLDVLFHAGTQVNSALSYPGEMLDTEFVDLRQTIGGSSQDHLGAYYYQVFAPGVATGGLGIPTQNMTRSASWAEIYKDGANASTSGPFGGASGHVHQMHPISGALVTWAVGAVSEIASQAGSGIPPFTRLTSVSRNKTQSSTVGWMRFEGDGLTFVELPDYFTRFNQVHSNQQHFGNDTVFGTGFSLASESPVSTLDPGREVISYGIDTKGNLVPEMRWSISVFGGGFGSFDVENTNYVMAPIGYADGVEWTAPQIDAFVMTFPDRRIDSECGVEFQSTETKILPSLYSRILGKIVVRGVAYPIEFYLWNTSLQGFWNGDESYEFAKSHTYERTTNSSELFASSNAFDGNSFMDRTISVSGHVEYLTIGCNVNDVHYSTLLHTRLLDALPKTAKYPVFRTAYGPESNGLCILVIDGNKVDLVNVYWKSLSNAISSESAVDVAQMSTDIAAIAATPKQSVTYGVAENDYQFISASSLARTDLAAWREQKYADFSAWLITLHERVLDAADAVNGWVIGDIASAPDLSIYFDDLVLGATEVVFNDLIEDASLVLYARLQKNLVLMQ